MYMVEHLTWVAWVINPFSLRAATIQRIPLLQSGGIFY